MEQGPEQPPQNPQEVFGQHYDIALDYLAAIKVGLQADHDNGQPKTREHARKMELIVGKLQEIMDLVEN
jgi:hypothetical protein